MEAVLWHVGNRCTNCLHLDISYLRNLTPDGVRTLTKCAGYSLPQIAERENNLFNNMITR